jgi:hypothetical protein
MSAQEVVASTLAGSNVSVVFDADVPWADLSNRVIHLRPVPDQLSQENIEDLRGDCDHELGHIIHTDPKAIALIKRNLLKNIVESIEDGRVERLVGDEWLGCGENLEKSSRRAIERIRFCKKSNEINRRARALCGLSLISNGCIISDVIKFLGDDISPYYEQLGDLTNTIKQCQSTQEVVNVAEKVINVWQWKPVGETKVKSKQALENAVSKELSLQDLSPASERKKAIQQIESGRTKGSYKAATDLDKVEGIRPPSFSIGNLYGLFFENVRKTASVLRHRLMMQFRSTGHYYRQFEKKGNIDERRLWRYGLGEDRIYQKRYPNKANRSIVTILIDCSASMTKAARGPNYDGEPLVMRTRLFIAAQAAAAISSVLDILQVPNEVLAFTTSRRTPPTRPGFDRVRPLRHLLIKPYNKPFRSCRGKFISLAFFEHCSENIDGEALLWAARRMLSKPKCGDRPVLMVFSDGEPASEPENNSVLAAHLKKSVERIEASGIEVFGIGAGSDAVREFYTNSAVVYDVSNILLTFYDLIKKALQERQGHRV